MAYTVNNNTFKNGNNKKKKNQWIPLIIIVVLALILVALNWFLLAELFNHTFGGKSIPAFYLAKTAK